MILYKYSIEPMTIVGTFGMLRMVGISIWIWRLSSKQGVVWHDFDGLLVSTHRKGDYDRSSGLWNLTFLTISVLIKG